MATIEKDVFSFHVRELEYGWCDVVMIINGKEIPFCASYIGEEPLASMIDACALLKEECDEYHIVWEDEPGTLKIDMELNDNGMLHFDIAKLDEDEDAEEKWHEIVPFDLVVAAITAEGFRVLNVYGLCGYRCSWQDHIDFPLANLLIISGEFEEMYEKNPHSTDFSREIGILQRHITGDEEELKRLLRERLKSIAEGTSKFVSHEEVMSEMEALLRDSESGSTSPCAYSHEQMEESLREAETDFQKGRFESHSSICKRYGV